MRRAFVASRILDTDTVVAHGDIYVPNDSEVDFDEGLRQVTQFYDPFAEYCIKNGLTLCFENLFDPTPAHRRYCARLSELKAIIKHYDSPNVCVCWDTGHGRISNPAGQIPALNEIGEKIRALHLHDNYFDKDLHLCPMMGKEDWPELIKALKKINYPGVFTFEFVYGAFSDTVLLSLLKVYRQIGIELTQMWEEA